MLVAPLLAPLLTVVGLADVSTVVPEVRPGDVPGE